MLWYVHQTDEQGVQRNSLCNFNTQFPMNAKSKNQILCRALILFAQQTIQRLDDPRRQRRKYKSLRSDRVTSIFFSFFVILVCCLFVLMKHQPFIR